MQHLKRKTSPDGANGRNRIRRGEEREAGRDGGREGRRQGRREKERKRKGGKNGPRKEEEEEEEEEEEGRREIKAGGTKAEGTAQKQTLMKPRRMGG